MITNDKFIRREIYHMIFKQEHDKTACGLPPSGWVRFMFNIYADMGYGLTLDETRAEYARIINKHLYEK